MNMHEATSMKALTDTTGYVCIPNLISEKECHDLVYPLSNPPAPGEWLKGHAVTCRHFHDLALDYRIVKHVQAALGTEDVLLWGASLLVRTPGQIHAWHCDIESCHPEAHVVSVWLALQNTSVESSLSVQPGSHLYGATVQEMAHRHQVSRDQITEEHITNWSRELGGTEQPVVVGMNDGDALFFDGRIWHGSHNLASDKTRLAVLLQYTTTDAPIRLPDFTQLSWPFRFHENIWPPCIRVSGKDRTEVNRIVTPPLLHNAENGQRLKSSTQSLPFPFVDKDFQGWKAFPFFRGFNHHLGDLSCHASVLSRGQRPHPPHQHPEEEILMVLTGRAEVTLPALAGTEAGETRVLEAGQFVYYPAGFYHTLTALSDEPSHYVMFKWMGNPVDDYPPLKWTQHDVYETPVKSLDDNQGFQPGLLFEGATRYLSKLHAHVTVLQPGAGYDPHADDYDVILILLEGEVKTLGQRLGPLGIIYYAAGDDHGISNPGSVPARYLVLELHGTASQRLHLGLPVPAPRAFTTGGDAALSPLVKKLEKLSSRLEKQITKQNETQKKLLQALPRRHQLSLKDKLLNKDRWARRLRRWTRSDKDA